MLKKVKVVSLYNAAIVYCMLSIYVLCTHGPKGLLYSRINTFYDQ